MNASARSESISIYPSGNTFVKIHPEGASQMLEVLSRLKTGDQVNIVISAQGRLEERDGESFSLTLLSYPETFIEKQFARRTVKQNDVLRGLERFIFWAQEGRRPVRDEELYWIHESLLEQYAPIVTNPITGKQVPMRTSDPAMSTVSMARIIEGALHVLAESVWDQKDVLDAIGTDLRSLWAAWYSWKWSEGQDESLHTLPSTWDEYREKHPVCEATGIPPNETDPCERMHIISKGADLPAYEEPWNWLHVRHSVHMFCHQHGWDEFLKVYPHLSGRRAHALKMAAHRKSDRR